MVMKDVMSHLRRLFGFFPFQRPHGPLLKRGYRLAVFDLKRNGASIHFFALSEKPSSDFADCAN